MSMRVFTIALLAGVSLGTVHAAMAQTAAAGASSTTAVKVKKVKKPRTAAIPNNVVAQVVEPAKPTRDRRSQAGLTSSPTDFGRVDISGAGGNGVTPPTGDGVNGQDLGGGYMIPEEATKTRSTVTRDAIAKQSPTANPYQLINLLPGVNQSSTDNTGLNGGNIKIRGYNSDQLGLTIEGMPVNDSGNYALYPQEYVDAENIDQISIAQGAPDLDSPHIGASGGVINIYMRDPSKVAGGFIDGSFGSNAEYRSFLRVESGQVGDFRGFLSFSHQQDQHWLSPGADSRNHVDFKGVWEPGQGNRVSLSLIYNWAINDFYPAATLAQFNAPGGYVNTYLPINTSTNYYEYKTNPFRNLIASAPSSFTINNNLTYDVVPYFWYGFGNGGGVTSITAATPTYFFGNNNVTVPITGSQLVSGGKVFFYNPSITETYRPGVINKLTYTMDDHKFVLGYWFEFASHAQTKPLAALTPDNKIVDPFLTSGAIYGTIGGATVGPLEGRNLLTKTITNTIFAGDTWSFLGGKLEAEYGAKVASINRTVDNYLPGATPERTSNDLVALPTFGLKYKVTDEHTLFGSINTGFKSTPNFALADTFSNGVLQPANPLKPERSVTLEVGHRYQGPLFATSLSLYTSHYDNHQISTNAIINGVVENGVTVNAGSADLWGVAFEVGTRPLWGGFRPYFSANYLQTRIGTNLQSDYIAGGLPNSDALPTKGKELPGSPHSTLALGLDYDNGHIIGNVAAKYTDKQYSTFMNDESIGAFTRVDAMIGYRFDDIGFGKKPELRLNLYNIFNSKALTGVSGITSNALAAVGVNGHTVAGSAPSYYLGQGFSAIATFSTAF